MDTISLCMIVRDEEPVLIRCLESAAGLYDELVIVDTGSADRTREIARGYTDKVYDFPWVDDFSAARNFAFERASMHYCMWLDADDVIPEDQRDDSVICLPKGQCSCKGKCHQQCPFPIRAF